MLLLMVPAIHELQLIIEKPDTPGADRLRPSR
jgi:hypothetical protein